MSASARAHRRRFLRQAGLAAADLDALSIAALDGWALAMAEGEHGAARLWHRELGRRLTDTGLDERVRARGRRDDGDDGFDLARLTVDERTTLAHLLRKGEGVDA